MGIDCGYSIGQYNFFLFYLIYFAGPIVATLSPHCDIYVTLDSSQNFDRGICFAVKTLTVCVKNLTLCVSIVWQLIANQFYIIITYWFYTIISVIILTVNLLCRFCHNFVGDRPLCPPPPTDRQGPPGGSTYIYTQKYTDQENWVLTTRETH